MSIISLPYQPDSLILAENFRHLPYFILLDSGTSGGPDIISAMPNQWAKSLTNTDINLKTLNSHNVYTEHTYRSGLDTIANKLHSSLIHAPTPGHWQASLIGTLSYESGYDNNFIDNLLTEDDEYNRFQLGTYSWALINNHLSKTTELHFTENCSSILENFILMQFKGTNKTAQQFHLNNPFTNQTPSKTYHEHIAKIHQYILAGDCYQVNYTQKFKANFSGDSWQAFKLIRETSPTPFGAFLDADEEQILCHSPERFIQIHQGVIETKPIKGTRKRGENKEEDTLLADELLNSVKDRAENLMIVDLLRNDIGRSAVPGSVQVPELFKLESYKNVHHLVSTISAKLDKKITPFECLLSAYPGGSITGAPKKRAMEIIHELEPVQRGPYCGSIFYWDADNNLDSNIMIRTLVAKNGELSVWGGGGIVMDSNSEDEYEESLTKISYIIRALELNFID